MVDEEVVVTGDELERLRQANPVQRSTAERLAAPHGAAFREAIVDTGHRRARREPGSSSTQRLRLSLAAAAIAVVALPAFLLTQPTGDEIVVRTPATNGPARADENVEQVPPISEENQQIDSNGTVVFTPARDDPAGAVDVSMTAPSAAATAPPTTIAGAPSPTIAPAAGSITTEAPTTSSTTITAGPVAAPPASIPAPPTVATTPPGTATTTPANTTAPAPTTIVTPSPTTPTTTEPPTTAPATSAPDTTAPDTTMPDTAGAAPFFGPFDPATDLLVIAFDFSHRDDGHASVAARELSTTYGLDPIVVAGTAAPESELFAHDYADMMTAAWGSGWHDAGTDRENAMSESAGRWLATIDAGGHVWVAEGGVSDFTAAVLRAVRAQRPGLDTSGIVHLIHHSSSNVDRTQPADLALVETHADVVRIDDGNSLNDSADLNGASDDFERIALEGPMAPAWATAFDYMPASSLDFSDTVTVLYALGIDLDVIANSSNFANVIMT